MKHILILMLVLGMLFSTGCFVAPVEPDPVEFPIVCEGGYHVVYYVEWSFSWCEEDPVYPAGTYWFNADGRVFLIGDTILAEDFFDVYEACPTAYVEEIFR